MGQSGSKTRGPPTRTRLGGHVVRGWRGAPSAVERGTPPWRRRSSPHRHCIPASGFPRQRRPSVKSGCIPHHHWAGIAERRLGGQCTGSGSGNAQIVMLPGRLSLLVGQLREPDRSDYAPVASDRAALDPRPTEAKCLQRSAWDPDRREEMSPPAADDDIAAYSVPTTKEGKCFSCKCADRYRQSDLAAMVEVRAVGRLQRGRSVVRSHSCTLRFKLHHVV
jgi:hypothetical protein